MVSYLKLKKVINAFEMYAIEKTKQCEYEKALDSLFRACLISHRYYFSFKNEITERVLNEIGKKFNVSYDNISSQKAKIIFYDSICNDRIALTYQYIEALVELNIPFVYVINSEKPKIDRVEILLRNNNIDIVDVRDNNSRVKTIEKIIQIVNKNSPNTALLHLNNGDVVGVAAWSCIKGVHKMLINHGDEQFWVGSSIIDNCICYRKTGCDIAINKRHLPRKAVSLIPYYPIAYKCKFKGFDFDIPENSIKLFSGGRYNKIYANDCIFIKTVFEILNTNPQCVFIFAGSGDSSLFKRMIEQQGLCNRCFLIPYRDDLIEVMLHIDIYICTFPVSGGLMAQYAAYAGKPLVELLIGEASSVKDVFSDINPSIKFSTNNMHEYIDIIRSLIQSKDLRTYYGEAMNAALPTKEGFEQQLDELISNTCLVQEYEEYNSSFDIRKRCDEMMEIDNNGSHSFTGLCLNKIILKKKPIIFLEAMCDFVWCHGFTSAVKRMVQRKDNSDASN